jgi:chemotaxis protein MotB
VARKKKHPEHVNHERWLISYADFITLLFAFFVVMFAVSQVDSKKVGRFTQSFNEALSWQVIPGSASGSGSGMIAELQAVAGSKKASDVFTAEKDAIRKGLAHRVGRVPALSGLTVLEVRGELVLRLPEKLMFDRGEALLSEEGKAALDAIADELHQRSVRLRVEGHSDATPIHTARFPSNWQLSMARAMEVVGFLLEKGKIEPGRMAAAGYGEHHPVASNDNQEGRAQNRRVDLIVVADFERTETAQGEGHAPANGTEPATAADTKAPSGDVKAPSGDTKAPSGDTKAPSGDTKAPSANAHTTAEGSPKGLHPQHIAEENPKKAVPIVGTPEDSHHHEAPETKR